MVTPCCAGDEGTNGGLHDGRRDGAQEDGCQREGGGLRPQQREESRAAAPAPNYGVGDGKLGSLHARRRGEGAREDGREREENPPPQEARKASATDELGGCIGATV